MGKAFVVIYKGQPEDQERFFDYYHDKHLPLVWAMPKIRRVEVLRRMDEGEFYIIAVCVFDNEEDLRAALSSPAREALVADVKNFPAFQGVTIRQKMEFMDIPAPA
ncbi:MAG: EthD family reductase [Thermodesulfobacteriota bacterium]